MNTQLEGHERLTGITEFVECIKTHPATEAGGCFKLITGDKGLEFDITKSPKFPVEIKPDWVWFAAGFLVAWILKR